MSPDSQARPDSAAVQPARGPVARTSAPGGTIDSRELLQGSRVIEITHEGATYRLQATRQGKLILTK